LEPTFIGNIKSATGATILGRNCSMAQIMAVTGHKSASSVAVYQRVSTKEKQVMTVSSEDSCTRCTNGVVGVDL
jgi:hypothetical protein